MSVQKIVLNAKFCQSAEDLNEQERVLGHLRRQKCISMLDRVQLQRYSGAPAKTTLELKWATQEETDLAPCSSNVERYRILDQPEGCPFGLNRVDYDLRDKIRM